MLKLIPSTYVCRGHPYKYVVIIFKTSSRKEREIFFIFPLVGIFITLFRLTHPIYTRNDVFKISDENISISYYIRSPYVHVYI